MITGSQKPPMQGCHWCENPASTLQITAIPSQTKVKNYKNPIKILVDEVDLKLKIINKCRAAKTLEN